MNEDTQYKDARQLALDFRDMKLRKDVDIMNFLLFGDFNMNPFEKGMIEPDGLNAVLSAHEALNEERVNWYKKFDYFYNPMWCFLGDRNYLTGEFRLPGSYYFRKTRSVLQTYWNVFDNVIMRPSVIKIFDFSSLKIIDHIGIESLVKENYRLKEEVYSDHLPITFKLFL